MTRYGKLLLDDVAEHAAKHGDADAAGDEHVRLVGVVGEEEASLRLFDVDLGPDRKLGERALEGGVTQARAEAEHTTLVRGGDDRDVSPWPLLVVVGRIEQSDPEVLARLEVDLFVRAGRR